MTTIRLGATTNIRVVKDGEVIFDGPCSVENISDGTMTLTPVTPLPEEPPAWTLVATSRNNPLRVFYRVEDRPGMRRPWRHVGGGWHTWAEVCDAAREDSGGVPEVLESETVKALREQWQQQTDRANALHELREAGKASRSQKEVDRLKAELDEARATVARVEGLRASWGYGCALGINVAEMYADLGTALKPPAEEPTC